MKEEAGGSDMALEASGEDWRRWRVKVGGWRR